MDLNPRLAVALMVSSVVGLIAGTLTMKAFGLPTPFG